jgi:hypothetical protein
VKLILTRSHPLADRTFGGLAVLYDTTGRAADAARRPLPFGWACEDLDWTRRCHSTLVTGTADTGPRRWEAP